jgi:hypothetical protein
MAKLFYSLEEAGERLGKSEGEVRDLINTGQLQEFRDGDRVMVKVDQVDLLAGDDASDDTGGIPIAQDQDEDTISLASDSGSAFAIDSPEEQSGISIFDEADELETADPSAQTQISDTGATDFGLDPSSSGSGLLDLTREVDDTSLGADLMDDVYSGGDTIGETVGGEAMSPVEGGELFETTTTQTETSAGAPAGVAVVAAERIDGGFSGFTFGAFLVVAIGMLLAFAVVVGTLTGGLQDLIVPVADNMTAVVGGLAGGFIVLGALCGFIMKGK